MLQEPHTSTGAEASREADSESRCGWDKTLIKYFLVWNPRTCEVTLHGENFFVNVIKLEIWGWGDYPALSEWMVNVISGAYERGKGGCDYRQERRGPQEGSRGKGTQKEKMLCWPWTGAGTKQGMQGRQLQAPEKAGRWIFPQSLQTAHIVSKNKKKKGKRYTCSQGKWKRRVLEPQNAPSQRLADRNWIAGAGGSLQEWVRGLPSWPLHSVQMSSFPVLQNWKCDAEKVSVCELSQPRGKRSSLSSTQPGERPVSLISIKKEPRSRHPNCLSAQKHCVLPVVPRKKGYQAPRHPVLIFPEGSSWDRCFTRVL